MSEPGEHETREEQVGAALDDFHAAAALADEGRYLGRLAPDAVFLGTDPADRWEGAEFRTFVHSLFAEGKGWTYTPSNRSIVVTEDGRTAWFDEKLQNDSYGECRGTGVLHLRDGVWKIEQYNLTIPVPDSLAAGIVKMIREAG
jgi:ketosteroid isomerase-like protein